MGERAGSPELQKLRAGASLKANVRGSQAHLPRDLHRSTIFTWWGNGQQSNLLSSIHTECLGKQCACANLTNTNKLAGLLPAHGYVHTILLTAQ